MTTITQKIAVPQPDVRLERRGVVDTGRLVDWLDGAGLAAGVLLDFGPGISKSMNSGPGDEVSRVAGFQLPGADEVLGFFGGGFEQ